MERGVKQQCGNGRKRGFSGFSDICKITSNGLQLVAEVHYNIYNTVSNNVSIFLFIEPFSEVEW